MRTVIHDIRNQLSVAIANVEAMIDGKLPPTPDRLRLVLDAVSEVDVLLNKLHGEESRPSH